MPLSIKTKPWTLRELHRLPDDGNRYELVRGELFVTPPPSDEHETLAALLARRLDPFVERHQLGFVFSPRAVMRYRGSQVEPDLMVRRRHRGSRSWSTAPLPLLAVEILSPATWGRDKLHKRNLYLSAGVPEYWIVDPEEREIRVVRAQQEDQVVDDTLIWRPVGVRRGLKVDVRALFREALD